MHLLKENKIMTEKQIIQLPNLELCYSPSPNYNLKQEIQKVKSFRLRYFRAL